MNATHTMSHQILDGKATSLQIEQELAEAVQERQAQGLKALTSRPCWLATIPRAGPTLATK